MKLNDYMKKEKLSYGKFAKLIGCSSATLYYFLNNEKKELSVGTIKKIILATKGKVTFKDLSE